MAFVGTQRALLSGSKLDPSTIALIARMTTPPTPSRVLLINSTIVALKSANIWSKLEVLYFFAAANAQAARLNWISSSFDTTVVSTPTFTADKGYAGDGSTSYLNTHWTASLSSIFTQDSASIGVYINAGTNTADNSRGAIGAIAASSGSWLAPRGASNFFRGRVNQGVTANYGASITSLNGFSALSRTSSALTTSYKNGVSNGTDTSTSNGRPNIVSYICGVNTTGSFSNGLDNQIAFAFAGAGLSAAEMALLYNIVYSNYLLPIGAN